MPELDTPVVFISFLLTLYTWGAVCLLLLFLFFIAQFYEKKSGRRSFFPTFLLSLVLFVIAAIRYASLTPAITGDFWGDVTRFLGGIILVIFGFMLLKYMMGGRA